MATKNSRNTKMKKETGAVVAVRRKRKLGTIAVRKERGEKKNDWKREKGNWGDRWERLYRMPVLTSKRQL
jgi:hypothetical protein